MLHRLLLPRSVVTDLGGALHLGPLLVYLGLVLRHLRQGSVDWILTTLLQRTNRVEALFGGSRIDLKRRSVCLDS